MRFDDLKQLAALLLKNYERAWYENAALRVILETYPMPDGTKGIPDWKRLLDSWLSTQTTQGQADPRFAELTAQIEQSQRESEVLELLLRLPTTGQVQ
jgi:hypothetical protein